MPGMIAAVRWWKHGDHPAVYHEFCRPSANDDGQATCRTCGARIGDHGWLVPRDGLLQWMVSRDIGHLVCPGDYIIRAVGPTADETYTVCSAAQLAQRVESVSSMVH